MNTYREKKMTTTTTTNLKVCLKSIDHRTTMRVKIVKEEERTDKDRKKNLKEED